MILGEKFGRMCYIKIQNIRGIIYYLWVKQIPHNSLSVQTWFLEHYFCYKCEPKRTSALSYNFFQSLLLTPPLYSQGKTHNTLSSLTVIINKYLLNLMAHEINLYFCVFVYIISIQTYFWTLYKQNFPKHT